MSHSFDSAATRQVVVAACFLALLVAPLSLSFPTAGLFVAPVSAAFGWDRATFFLGPSIGAMAGALAAPFLGALADKWGAWRILAAGVTIYAAGIAGLGLMQGSLGVYLALSVLLYSAGQVQSSAIYSRVISSWFDRSRGMMIAIATSGLAAGGIVFPMLAKHLVAELGWRHAYFALALIAVVIALPPILFAVRERTQVPTATSSAQAPLGLTLREAAAGRTYWLILSFFFLAPFAMTGLAANIVPMLTARGLSLDHAVMAVSTVALSQALGRVASGILLDKVRVPQISLIWFIGCGAGLAALYFAHSPATAVVAAALIGMAWGAEGEISGYYVGRYFGLRHFARIAGTLFTALGVGAGASQWFVAWLVDRTGGYAVAVIVSLSAMLIACALLACLRPYVYPPAHD